MKTALALPLALLLTITGCARPEASGSRVLVLEARVAKLEAQVTALRRAQETGLAGAGSAGPQQATARAAAQYCATQLASTLEQYRQDNARYPGVKEVVLPSACQDFRVSWTRLEEAHYRFGVSGPTGEVLASEAR